MKNTKRIIILALTVLFVVLSATVAIIAAGTPTEKDDLGESLKSHQVSLDGRVNLRFKYTGLGDADAFVVEAPSETYTLTRAEIEASSKVISVALAPSEMTHSVKVYPVKLDGDNNITEKGKGDTYSVKDYATSVLGKESYAKYHNMVRALLNWGAMAQSYFDPAAEGAPANLDLYGRDTNPVAGVGTDTIDFAAHSAPSKSGTVFKSAGANLHLDRNDIALSVYIYTDSTDNTAQDFTATLNRDGFESAKTVALRKVSDGKYAVKISNISVNLFDTLYTLEVKTTDEGSTLKVQVSVLEYLDLIVEGKSDNPTDAQINTAKSLYQFYTFAIPQEAPYYCAHNITHRLNNKDASASTIVCSECFEVVEDRAIGNAAAVYLNAEALKSTSSFNQGAAPALYLKSENGESFVRLQGLQHNSWWHWEIVENANAPVSGQYMVIKLRLGADNKLYNSSNKEYDQTVLELYASTQKDVLGNSNQMGQIVVSEDGQWHTIVYDLSQIPEFTAVDGTYAAKYLSFRPFGNGGENKGDYTNGYMDVRFIAFCDTLEEIEKVGDTYTYEISNGHKAESITYMADSAVNGYISASDLANYKFATISGKNNKSYYTVTSRSGYSADVVGWTRWGNGEEQYDPISVGNAKYLVLKLRGKRTSGTIDLTVGTTQGELVASNSTTVKKTSVRLPTYNLSRDEWTSYVIKLDDIMKNGWGINDAQGEYVVTDLRITYNDSENNFPVDGNGDPAIILDIAHMAFVDDIGEVSKLVDGGTVELLTSSDRSSVEYGINEDEVNAYLGAEHLSGIAGRYLYNIEETELADNSYYQITSKQGVTAGNLIWTRYSDRYYPFGAGTAKYMVLKMRGTAQNQSIGVTVGTIVDTTEARASVNLPLNKLHSSNWTTFVIPLDSILSDGWKPDTDGTYTVSTLLFTYNDYTNKFKDTMTVDYGYIAFVDDWSEIAALCDTETVEVITGSATSVTYNPDGSKPKCTGDCTLTYVNTPDGNGNTLYQAICSACGTVYASHTVSDKVNFYYDVSAMTKVSHYDNGGTVHTEKKIENGVAYLEKKTATDNSTYLAYLSGSNAAASSYKVTLGQYFVIKYRSADTSGNLQFELNINGQDSVMKSKISVESVSSDWQTTVIDISTLAGYVKGESKNLLVQFRNTANMDIAYLAIVDDLDEARSLLADGETYYLTDSFANRGTQYSKSGLPSKTDREINAYLDQSFISDPKGGYVGMSVSKLEDTDSTAYYHITSQANPSLGCELVWMRPRAASPNQYNPFSVGQAKYLVIKAKGAVTNENCSISITLGTSKGELVYTNTATSNASVIVPADKLSVDKWTTFAVDLQSAMSDGWKQHETGEYVVTYMKLTFVDTTGKNFTADEQGNPAVTFDIAEMAFVDSWAEITAVTDTENIEYMTASGTSSTYGRDGSNLAAVDLNKDVESMITDKQEGELQFLYFADIHRGLDHWNRIVGYANTYSEHIDFLIHAGDYLGNTNDPTKNKDLYALGSAQSIKPIYNVVGNHDTFATVVNGATTTIPKEYVIATLFNHTENWGVMYMDGEAVNTAYYRDFPNEQVRLIVLDNYYDEGAQALWLKALLAEAKDLGYSVLTSSHIGTAPLTEVLDTNFTAALAADGDDPGNASLTKVTPFDKIIAEFKSNGGNHIAHLIGHWHKDYIGKTASGVLNICVEGATSTYIIWDQLDGRSKDPAEKDYDAFDVITVNATDKTFEIVRVGNTTDSQENEKISLKIDYTTGAILAENGVEKTAE